MPKVSAFAISAIFLLSLLAPLLAVHQLSFAETEQGTTDTNTTVVISEIHLKAQHNAYVQLYNSTQEAVNLDGWRLQYLHVDSEDWVDRISAGQDNEDWVIQPNDYFVMATNAYTDDHPDVDIDLRINWSHAPNYGHLRIVSDVNGHTEDDEGLTRIDTVSWGDVEPIEADSNPADMPNDTESISLCFVDSEIRRLGDDSKDFLVVEHAGPRIERTCPDEDYDADEIDDNGDDAGGQTDPDEKTGDEKLSPEELCEGIVISEVLPNPEGPRSEYPREDNAYIELYNSKEDTVSLEGCGLQSTTNDVIHWFDDTHEIASSDYKVFYERDTGVQLPVAPSGTVYLLDASESEVESTTYPENMPEAASWAWFGNDTWDITYAPTPGFLNEEQPLRPCPEGQERNPDTNRCRTVVPEESSLTPCLEGQERNPETNRCRNIEPAAHELVPCAPHQERNPDTNRCRNIHQPERELVPCEPHQERNPETNRCRNIESAASELGPCPEGQERNPDTNRCRTVAQPNSDVMSVQDIKVEQTTSLGSWALSGSFVGAALAYGAWEWRMDARRWFAWAKRRLQKE
jgi:hypothetical protein